MEIAERNGPCLVTSVSVTAQLWWIVVLLGLLHWAHWN